MHDEQMEHQDGLFFTIKEASKEIGVVPATIRNWEKQGLFTARRSKSGYRIYTLADIESLRSIKKYSKDENMGMKAIRKFYGGQGGTSLPQKQPDAEPVSKRLLSQKWKDYRNQRGYLLEDVATEVGISSSYLSKIENGQANVSYEILQKLAAFYGENILYYIGDTEEERHLVRKDEGEVFTIGIEGLTVESIVALKKHTLSSLIYTVEPGSGRFSPSSHSGEEFVHVLAGRIRMKINDQEHVLKVGDSMSFRSTEEHSWYNCGKTTARLLWVYTPLVQE